MISVSSPESVIQGVICEKVNQKVQNPPGFDLWLNSIRERVEGAFNEVQNTGRNLERLLRKTVVGLITHVIAKMASHALKLVLRRFFGIDVQTFEMIPAWSHDFTLAVL